MLQLIVASIAWFKVFQGRYNYCGKDGLKVISETTLYHSINHIYVISMYG